MSPQERQPRVSTRLPIVETDSGKGVYYTKNLSIGGLFVLVEQRWPVGSQVALAIVYGGTRLEFKARVTHLQRDGVGLCFTNPSDEVRTALKAIIEAQIPQSKSGIANTLRSAVGLSTGPRIVWSDGTNRFESAARDITARGAFFESSSLPAIGSTVIVYLPATVQNDDDEVEHELRGCTGEVMSHGREGFEVRFTAPSAEFRMALDHLLRPAT